MPHIDFVVLKSLCSTFKFTDVLHGVSGAISGPVTMLKLLSQRLQDHYQGLQSLSQKAWALEGAQKEQEEFVLVYDQQVCCLDAITLQFMHAGVLTNKLGF